MKTVFVVFNNDQVGDDSLVAARNTFEKAAKVAREHKPAVIMEVSLNPADPGEASAPLVDRWELT